MPVEPRTSLKEFCFLCREREVVVTKIRRLLVSEPDEGFPKHSFGNILSGAFRSTLQRYFAGSITRCLIVEEMLPAKFASPA